MPHHAIGNQVRIIYPQFRPKSPNILPSQKMLTSQWIFKNLRSRRFISTRKVSKHLRQSILIIWTVHKSNRLTLLFEFFKIQVSKHLMESSLFIFIINFPNFCYFIPLNDKVFLAIEYEIIYFGYNDYCKIIPSYSLYIPLDESYVQIHKL